MRARPPLARLWQAALLGLALMLTSGVCAASCARTVDISPLDVQSQPTTVVLVGEWHGTAEIPRVVGDISCALLERGSHVQVALELPVDWTDDLNAYVNSQAGESLLRDKLAKRWNKLRGRGGDGRTSEAMWQLIEALGLQARAYPGAVRVTAFDSRQWEARFAGDQMVADLGMSAALIRAVEESPGFVTIALTGELHARALPNTISMKPRPMAYAMTVARPAWRILPLKAAARDGFDPPSP